MQASASHAPYVPPPLPRRVVTAGRALYALARDPNQLERVFEIGEALNAPRIPQMLAAVAATPDGGRLLRERPTIDKARVDFDALGRLPEGTLGKAYVRFLRDNGITPDVFKLPPIADDRVAYVMLRIRQTHDLWHVLTGYEPDVTGEVLLQIFTYAQLGAPSALALSVLGAVRYGRKTRGFWRRAYDAYRRGRATRPLATFLWEEHWADSLGELRGRLTCPAEARVAA